MHDGSDNPLLLSIQGQGQYCNTVQMHGSAAVRCKGGSDRCTSPLRSPSSVVHMKAGKLCRHAPGE